MRWLLLLVAAIMPACSREPLPQTSADLAVAGADLAVASADLAVASADLAVSDAGPPRPCASNDDCPPGKFCGRLDGICMPWCSQGFSDCDGRGANGCEVFIDSDLKNCGACGKACGVLSSPHADSACVRGSCVARCHPGFDACDHVDRCDTVLATDTHHCGRCGNACAWRVPCVNGVCTPPPDML